MMLLLFGHLADPDRVRHGLFEVFEAIRPQKKGKISALLVACVANQPLGINLREKRSELFARQRRDIAAARNADFFGKRAHHFTAATSCSVTGPPLLPHAERTNVATAARSPADSWPFHDGITFRPCSMTPIMPFGSPAFTSESPPSAGNIPPPPPCPFAPLQLAHLVENIEAPTVFSTAAPAAATCCSLTPDALLPHAERTYVATAAMSAFESWPFQVGILPL